MDLAANRNAAHGIGTAARLEADRRPLRPPFGPSLRGPSLGVPWPRRHRRRAPPPLPRPCWPSLGGPSSGFWNRHCRRRAPAPPLARPSWPSFRGPSWRVPWPRLRRRRAPPFWPSWESGPPASPRPPPLPHPPPLPPRRVAPPRAPPPRRAPRSRRAPVKRFALVNSRRRTRGECATAASQIASGRRDWHTAPWHHAHSHLHLSCDLFCVRHGCFQDFLCSRWKPYKIPGHPR